MDNEVRDGLREVSAFFKWMDEQVMAGNKAAIQVWADWQAYNCECGECESCRINPRG